MPVFRSHDRRGQFWRYGKNGKKYYYKSFNAESSKTAKGKAKLQAKAIATTIRKRKEK